jgi:hypothetical protein
MVDETIQAQITDLRNSDEIKNAFHPSHEAALKTLSELYSRGYPEATPEATPTAEQPTPEQPTAEPTPDPLAVPQAELDGLDGLRSEWGSEFDANLQQAQNLAGEFAKTYGNEFVDWMEESRAGSHPLIVKSFAAWAKGESGPDVSPTEARELIEVLRGGTYYAKGNSRMHDVLHQVISKLYEIGYTE